MNSVVLSGRISSEVELKYTPNGTAMAKFSIAVRDPFRKNEDGKASTDFFDVVVWRKAAEFTAEYLAKGSPVAIKGRIRQEKWKTQDGETRQKVVVNAEDVESNGPAPGAKDGQGEAQAPKPAAKPAPKAEEPEYDPFAGDDV